MTRRKLHKNATCCFQQNLEAAPHQTAAEQPRTSNPTNYTRLKEQYIEGTIRGLRTMNSNT